MYERLPKIPSFSYDGYMTSSYCCSALIINALTVCVER